MHKFYAQNNINLKTILFKVKLIALIITISPIYLLAQSNTEKQLAFFENTAKKTNISSDKIKAIKKLVKLKNERIEAYHADYRQQDTTSIIFFFDKKISPGEARRKFKEELAQVINLSEFEVLFKPVLQPRIDREVAENWKAFEQQYKLDKRQKEILHKIISHYTEKELFASEFYNYDGAIAYAKLNELKAEKNAALQKALTGLDLTMKAGKSANPKIDYFVAKARQADVSELKIQKLLQALKERDEKVASVAKDWQAFDSKYLVYFHDHETTKDVYLNEFKKTLNQLITQEQFEVMFKEQLNPRIKRIANKRLNEVKAAYELEYDQEQIVKKMLREGVEKEILIKEYYGYNDKLSKQKLRAAQFRFDRKYKQTLMGMNLKPNN